MIEFLLVGAGGFIGWCLRFFFTKLMLPMPVQVPLATLFSNIIAGFLVGFLTGMEKETSFITPRAKLFLTTGMLGGLSTFSTFSMETINLFLASDYIRAFGNIIFNLIFSFLGVLLGMFTAKMLFKNTAA